MGKRGLIISTVILIILGWGIAFWMQYEGGSAESIAGYVFYPIWLIGMFFCIYPFKRWVPWLIGFEGFKHYRREKKNDKYDILANLLGGLILAYVVIFGWVVGLIKYISIIYKLCRYGERSGGDRV